MHYMDILFAENMDLSIHLYSATALLVAAKVMEVDERVPVIANVKKYMGYAHP
jgi:hypothetical protein